MLGFVRSCTWGTWSAAMIVALFGCAAAHASSAPDDGVAFAPPDLPAARFAVAPPVPRTIAAADGTSLYTDTWLPAAKDGNAPPERVPVVVVYTPYATKGATDYHARIIETLVPRGYALTYAHVRGTGGSGGCPEQTADHEVDDGARIIEDAGERAPWASGVVGMYGLSYPGATIIATATGPDRRRLQSLKAVIVGAPTASRYHFYHHDGVPLLGYAQGGFLAVPLVLSNPTNAPEHLAERPGCQGEMASGSLDLSGDYTPFWAARDHVKNIARLAAPILMWHGTADAQVGGLMLGGLFDGLPAGLPHKGQFGVHDHSMPDDLQFNEVAYTEPQLDWERADWQAMAFAWYQRWLGGVGNGVERWPAAQVQGTDGQWRTASTWPRPPGPAASLALGPGGLLGAEAPAGETSYTETPLFELHKEPDLQGTAAVFETPPLSGRLELLGAPALDLWVVLEQPDSHITARLEALAADGQRALYQARTIGARSARHLDPLVGGRFLQQDGRPAPVGAPVKITVRFNPIDLVVPKGGSLRLTLAGSSIGWNGADQLYTGAGVLIEGPTQPSFLVQQVTVLHSCTHHSVLRMTLPERSSRLLDVRERDQAGALGQNPRASSPPVDGGGLATRPSCGAPAATPAAVTPPRLSAVATLPSMRRCDSRRRFRIRLRHPRGARIKIATVSVNGKRVATRRGRRATTPVDLRRLPRGRIRVRVVVRLVDGRVVQGGRAYRSCRR